MIALAPALLMFAAAGAGQSGTLDAAVRAVYPPYQRKANATAVWDRPIFSAAARALIARWRAVAPADEPDALSDGDWLCQCQDWDSRRFHAIVRSRTIQPGGSATVEVRLALGFGQPRPVRLLLVREAGGWKLDDLFAADFPRGLRQALRETIEADKPR